MGRFDVRRLAAVDMYGTVGGPRRRWVILVEFVAGALIGLVVGVLAMGVHALGTRIFGVWLFGTGLNYAALAVHAIGLIRPGALDAELSGVDTRAELRYYAAAQLWVAVPVVLLALALWQVRRRPAGNVR